jgi:hypothetical protein
MQPLLPVTFAARGGEHQAQVTDRTAGVVSPPIDCRSAWGIGTLADNRAPPDNVPL